MKTKSICLAITTAALLVSCEKKETSATAPATSAPSAVLSAVLSTAPSGEPKPIHLVRTTAKPGDAIAIYALGCGPTSRRTQAGTVAAQASALSSPYRLRIGGQKANVTFVGMVGGTIGLYPFNVVVRPSTLKSTAFHTPRI